MIRYELVLYFVRDGKKCVGYHEYIDRPDGSDIWAFMSSIENAHHNRNYKLEFKKYEIVELVTSHEIVEMGTL